MKTLLQSEPVGDSDPIAESDHKDRGKCHQSQPADLYAAKNDYLAKQRKVRAGIYDDQPRNARRGNCRKERIDERHPLAASRGDRQREQNSSQSYHQRKTGNNYLCRIENLPKPSIHTKDEILHHTSQKLYCQYASVIQYFSSVLSV